MEDQQDRVGESGPQHNFWLRLTQSHFRKYTEIPIIFNKEHLEMELNLLSEFTVIKMEMAQPWL